MAGSERPLQSTPTSVPRKTRRAAAQARGRELNAIPFLIAAGLVLLVIFGLLWWFLWRDADAGEEASWEWVEEPADGVHAREVPPEDWEDGWCLSNYVDEESPADVVDCAQTYDRQILHRRNISDGPYPGDAEVADTAHQWCQQDLELNAEALEDVDYELEIQLWHPTESTWRGDYDRMVSCFMVRADGAGLTGNFLAEADADEETITPEETAEVEVSD